MGTELAEASGTVDVLAYKPGGESVYRAVPSGTGEKIVAAHEAEARKRTWLGVLTILVLGAVGATLFGFRYGQGVGAAWAVACLVGSVVRYRRPSDVGPELVERGMFPGVAADEYEITSYTPEAFGDGGK